MSAERAALVGDRIAALAQELLDKTGVPGMAVAVVGDMIADVGGFGVRHLAP